MREANNRPTLSQALSNLPLLCPEYLEDEKCNFGNQSPPILNGPWACTFFHVARFRRRLSKAPVPVVHYICLSIMNAGGDPGHRPDGSGGVRNIPMIATHGQEHSRLEILYKSKSKAVLFLLIIHHPRISKWVAMSMSL